LEETEVRCQESGVRDFRVEVRGLRGFQRFRLAVNCTIQSIVHSLCEICGLGLRFEIGVLPWFAPVAFFFCAFFARGRNER
jgi:hypothetical protein